MSTKFSVSKRVFIVGCPRSGTTLLQGLVGAHPKIRPFPETHFFSFALPKNDVKRLITWPAFNVQGVLESFLKGIGREDLVQGAKIGLLTRDYGTKFVELLDRITLEEGKEIWVEKTPRHLHLIEEITQQVPNCSFIHIVRNGTDVVASLYEVTKNNPVAWTKGRRPGFSGKSVEECIARWNHDVAITAKFLGKPRHHIVRYETLLKEPERTLVPVADFLEIEFDPRMLGAEQVYEKIVGFNEPWKENNARPIHSPKPKFAAIFDAPTRKQIREALIEIDF